MHRIIKTRFLSPYEYVVIGKKVSETTRQRIKNEFRKTKIVRCPVCGGLIRYEDKWQIAHIVSRFHGGEPIFENLTVTHPKCNRGTDDIDIFIQEMEENERYECLLFGKRL